MENNMKSKLKEWISKTGYPLEIFTESILVNNDYKVVNSYIYSDSENSILRELDLFATKNWTNNYIHLDINLIIECKKSTKPFVLLKNQSIKPRGFSLGDIYGSDDLFFPIFLSGCPKHIDMPANSENGFRLVQGFTDTDETIYKAVNTLLKSFNSLMKEEDALIQDYIQDNVHSFNIPVLAIDAPFFSLQLKKDLEFELIEIESGILHQMSHLNRFENYPFPLPIIKKEQLDIFLKSINEFGALLFGYLVENKEYNINNITNLTLEQIRKK